MFTGRIKSSNAILLSKKTVWITEAFRKITSSLTTFILSLKSKNIWQTESTNTHIHTYDLTFYQRQKKKHALGDLGFFPCTREGWKKFKKTTSMRLTASHRLKFKWVPKINASELQELPYESLPAMALFGSYINWLEIQITHWYSWFLWCGMYKGSFVPTIY